MTYNFGPNYFRHPDNRYGQGSKEFWDAEYKLTKLDREEYHKQRESQASKCPHCGTAYGYAFGTGNCGCEYEQ